MDKQRADHQPLFLPGIYLQTLLMGIAPANGLTLAQLLSFVAPVGDNSDQPSA